MQIDEGLVTGADGVKLHYRRLGAGARTLVIPNGELLIDDFAFLTDRLRVIVYDPRHRGRSETVTDPALLRGGIRNDVDDLENLRAQFGLPTLELLAHSYAGVLAALYAIAHPTRVARIVQIGPMQPFAGKQYAAPLANDDGVLGRVFARLQSFQQQSQATGEVERCRGVWRVLRELYVTDPANASRTDWGRCDLPNERNFMAYWMQHLAPSIAAEGPVPADLARVSAPVLIVHGNKDRSAPYGGGRDWALHLGNARLVTVPDGGHAPWIEAPDLVFAALNEFLDGEWPERAERVSAL